MEIIYKNKKKSSSKMSPLEKCFLVMAVCI